MRVTEMPKSMALDAGLFVSPPNLVGRYLEEPIRAAVGKHFHEHRNNLGMKVNVTLAVFGLGCGLAVARQSTGDVKESLFRIKVRHTQGQQLALPTTSGGLCRNEF